MRRRARCYRDMAARLGGNCETTRALARDHFRPCHAELGLNRSRALEKSVKNPVRCHLAQYSARNSASHEAGYPHDIVEGEQRHARYAE
jgi:hypothetical protein